jgi:hypothetical protein
MIMSAEFFVSLGKRSLGLFYEIVNEYLWKGLG